MRNLGAILLVAFSLTVLGLPSTALAAKVHGVLRVVKGKVKIKSGKTGKIKRARVGQKVYPLDTVITEKNARAKIVMIDKNEINISPASKVTLEKYEYKGPSKKAAKNVLLNVLYGKVRNKVKQKYNGKTSKFQVKTPSAVAGVRGTDFFTSYSASTQKTQVVTFKGQVAFGLPGANGTIQNPVQIRVGQMANSLAGKPPAPPVAVPKNQLASMDRDSAATPADTTTDKREPAADQPKEENKEEPKKKGPEKDDKQARNKGPKKGDKQAQGDKGPKGDNQANSDQANEGPEKSEPKKGNETRRKGPQKNAENRGPRGDESGQDTPNGPQGDEPRGDQNVANEDPGPGGEDRGTAKGEGDRPQKGPRARGPRGGPRPSAGGIAVGGPDSEVGPEPSGGPENRPGPEGPKGDSFAGGPEIGEPGGRRGPASIGPGPEGPQMIPGEMLGDMGPGLEELPSTCENCGDLLPEFFDQPPPMMTDHLMPDHHLPTDCGQFCQDAIVGTGRLIITITNGP